MIPKVIHYCWFGGGQKSELIEACIQSWRKWCPDWEIVEWNERNWDVNYNLYTKEAYRERKWAFVSDVARLDIIHKQGGIYLDTDVELLASLDAHRQKAWAAFESVISIATGLGFGAEQGNPAVEAMLEAYSGRSFYKGRGALKGCPYYNTKSLQSRYAKLVLDGTTQDLGDILILSHNDYSYFARHHSAASWTDTPKEKMGMPYIYHDSAVKRYLREPKRLAWIEAHLGETAYHIYCFRAYDLLEHGGIWFCKKGIKKAKNMIWRSNE